MVRALNHEDIARLEQAYEQFVQKIFFSIFSNEWLTEYLFFAEFALQENQSDDLFGVIEDEISSNGKDEVDPLIAAKSFFIYAWNTFLSECFEKKIVIGRKQAESLLVECVPGYEKIWKSIINLDKDDLDKDLEMFRRLAQSQIHDFLMEQEERENQERAAELEKIEKVADEKLGNLLQNYRPDRTDTKFAIAFSELVDYLVAKNIACSVGDLQEVLFKLYPNLPFQLQQAPRQYQEKLAKTKKAELKKPQKRITIDVVQIVRRLTEDQYEPLECLASINADDDTISVIGKIFKLKFATQRKNGVTVCDKDSFLAFNKILHAIMEPTRPKFYHKRLLELLSMMHNFASAKKQEKEFAEYVYRSYKIHKDKYLESIKDTSREDNKWQTRFPALMSALMYKHAKLTDAGHVG